MKRKTLTSLMVAALLVLLTGCSTVIGFRTLVPAAVDVTGYRTIAIRSTTDDSNWNVNRYYSPYVAFRDIDPRYYGYLLLSPSMKFSGNNVALYTTDRIAGALNKGFFDITGPTATDGLVALGKRSGTSVREQLLQNNVDAILSTSIRALSYDEYLTSERDYYTSKDSNGAEYHKQYFYLVQSCSVTVTYTLTDVENNRIIAYDTISRQDVRKTIIGDTIDADGTFHRCSYHVPEAAGLVYGLVDRIVSELAETLSPHYETESFSLMANKPKTDSVKKAYTLAENGSYQAALQVFLKEYNTSGHVPSGYNAAILYYVLGMYDEAFDLARDVFDSSGNPQAMELYYRLREVKAAQDAAEAQIYSTEKSVPGDGWELIGF